MKKNVMTRIASGLMVAVLLTTCVISGTFAKYVSEGSASDTARVAKWGVVVEAKGTLFGTDYTIGSTTAGYPVAHDNNDNHSTEITVCADDHSSKVVAPGTNSENPLKFSINGQPEVTTKVTITSDNAEDIYLKNGLYGVMVEAEGIDDDDAFDTFIATEKLYILSGGDYVVATDFSDTSDDGMFYTFDKKIEVNVTTDDGYYPVVYTLYGNGDSLSSDSHKATVIANKLKDGTKTFDTNTDLSSEYGDFELSWAWAFGTAGAKTGNDEMDTFLGDLIATTDFATDFAGLVYGGADADGFVVLSKDGNDIKGGSDAVVAHLKTNLNLTIRVEQVD